MKHQTDLLDMISGTDMALIYLFIAIIALFIISKGKNNSEETKSNKRKIYLLISGIILSLVINFMNTIPFNILLLIYLICLFVIYYFIKPSPFEYALYASIIPIMTMDSFILSPFNDLKCDPGLMISLSKTIGFFQGMLMFIILYSGVLGYWRSVKKNNADKVK